VITESSSGREVGKSLSRKISDKVIKAIYTNKLEEKIVFPVTIDFNIGLVVYEFAWN